MSTVARVTAEINLKDNLSTPLAAAGKNVSKFAAKTGEQLAEAAVAWQMFGNKAEAAAKKMKTAGTMMTIGVTAPLILAARKAINAASDLNETITKTEAVFRRSTAQVDTFAKTAAKSFGLSRKAALDYASSFGLILQAGGKTEAQSAAMSVTLAKLSSDLASFYNVDLETASQKIKSGLVGEAEPLRAFGVLLSETAVKTKALAMGFKMVGGNLTEAAKVQARYQIILDQTVKAQGDFARTSGGLANQQRILKAEVENLSAKFGDDLLPIMLDLVKTGRDLVKSFTALDAGQRQLIIKLAVLAAAMGPVMLAMSGFLSVLASIVKIRATYLAAQASIALANAATGASATAATGAMTALRLATLGLIALAAVPIIITVKAVYDFKEAADAALKSASTAASISLSPNQFHAAQKRKNPKITRDESYALFKKSRYYEPFMESATAAGGGNRKDNVQAFNARAAQDAAVARLRNATNQGAVGGGGGGGGRAAAAKKEDPELARRKSVLEEIVQLQRELNAAKMEAAGATAKDVIAMREYGKLYKDIGKDYHKQKVDVMAATAQFETDSDAKKKALEEQASATKLAEEKAAAAIKARSDAYTELNRTVGESAAKLAKEREQLSFTTEEAKARWEVEKGGYKEASGFAQALYVLQARLLDQATRAKDAGAKWAAFWAEVRAKQKAWIAEQNSTASERYEEYLHRLTEEMLKLSGAADAVLRADLTEQFKGLAVGAKTAAEGAARVRAAVDDIMGRTKAAEEMKARLEQIRQFAAGIENVFANSLDALFENGFKGFFDSVIQGFRDMARQIAVEWAKAQIMRLLLSAFGGGGGGGGGNLMGMIPGLPQAAMGGATFGREPHIVGENGPEVFIPNGSGRIMRNDQLAGAGGGSTNIIVNLQASNYQAFRRSEGQSIAQVFGRAARARAREGR